MRIWKVWLAMCVVCAGIVAGVAVAGNPHAPGCKGDPHKCTVTAPTTSTQETPPAQTVTVTAPTSSTSTSTSTTVYTTTTIVVPPSADLTILRVKVKTVRRYCTRQRHGWRCYKKRPPYAPHR